MPLACNWSLHPARRQLIETLLLPQMKHSGCQWMNRFFERTNSPLDCISSASLPYGTSKVQIIHDWVPMFEILRPTFKPQGPKIFMPLAQSLPENPGPPSIDLFLHASTEECKSGPTRVDIWIPTRHLMIFFLPYCARILQPDVANTLARLQHPHCTGQPEPLKASSAAAAAAAAQAPCPDSTSARAMNLSV